MIQRFLSRRLPSPDTRRLVMVTGARQTGKTTLARMLYPSLRYISLDEVEARLALRTLATRAWSVTVGPAILDEAQKEPSLFEKLKFAFDQGEIDFSVLLGSSQITMLARVRETLAGRVFVYELWPLLLAEMTSAENSLSPPIFDQLLTGAARADELFASLPPLLVGEQAFGQTQWLHHLLAWGGMPGILDLSETERRDWLYSYTNTYLERDLSDMARLDDLVPFRRFLRLAALRSGQLLSYADLARDADVSPTTARNYLNYLLLSYQAFLLQPYFASQTKRLVKAPRLYWTDAGLWRQQTGFWGELTGELFETVIVSEIYKWVKTIQSPAELWFYRTHGGLEVDLLITTPAGVWGLEVKTSRHTHLAQAASLRRVAEQFGDQWRGGLLVYQGNQLQRLESNLWAVPAARLLSAQ